MSAYVIQGIFAAAGLVALLAAVFDRDWFFTSRNAAFIVQNVGRTRARLFYGVLGLIMLGMALFFYLNSPT